MIGFNKDDLAAGLGKLKKAPPSSSTKKETYGSGSGPAKSLSIQARRGFSLERGEKEDIDRYQQYILQFNMEVWMDTLGSHTFPTRLVSLSKEDGREFIRLYEDRSKAKDMGAVMVGLQERLEEVMKGFKSCFVKTSSRSAKDFADSDRLKRSFKQVLSELDASENSKLIAISYASMELLKMKNAKQVVNNFAQSERIWHDMQLALAQAEEAWNESIVVREWVDIEPDMEFRCFVVDGVLTAVSQYRHLIHFPRLAANEALFSGIIVKFLGGLIKEQLQGVFPKDDYIVDVALELQAEFGPDSVLDSSLLQASCVKKCWVVEVNPFFETTDACLFSWSKDIDVLLDSKVKTPAVRMRKAAARGASSLIYGVWKEILAEG